MKTEHGKVAVAPAKSDPKQQALDTIKRWLGAKTSTLETLLGSQEAAKRFGQVLILACLRNPALLTCDLQSLFLAALYCAQRGLEPGVPDGCALVPYKGKVTPIPQYRALVKQAIETGSVRSAKAILIHANDQVEWEEGMCPRFVHRPAPLGSDRGPVVGAYSRIVLPDGSVDVEIMDIKDIYKRRDTSAAWRDGHNRQATPWGQWEAEMIRKTALKNGLRTIPVAPKLRELIYSDGQLEAGAEIVDMDGMDVTILQEEDVNTTSTKADALADRLSAGRQPEAVVEPEAQEPGPQTEAVVAATLEPPHAESEPMPDETQEVIQEQAGGEDPRDQLRKLYALAVKKNIVGLVLRQFRMTQWDDFLSRPEMVPSLRALIEQYQPPGKGRRK